MPSDPSPASRPPPGGTPRQTLGSTVTERMLPRLREVRSQLGMQGRVVLCIIGVLAITLGATVYTYVKHAREQVADLMGEQARQMSASLAVAGERAVRLSRQEELDRIAREVIKNRNVVYVAFLDTEGAELAKASRDPDVDLRGVTAARSSSSLLMQVRRERSPLFGEYLESVAPVLTAGREGTVSRLAGYAAVGVSQEAEAARIHSITLVVSVIAMLAAALAVLLSAVLVHHIFAPIRQLAAATHRIAGGDLDARVDIHRGDAIGQLAGAFNDMVVHIQQQRSDLADANTRLVQANHDLEAKVARRTSELESANARLTTEINDKEEFLRAVSHDLGAPLRNIDGMATMLLMRHREKLDADVVHRLERIKKNVEMETGLIAELLELSRIRTRRQRIERVDVDAMVRQLREMFDEDLRARQIELAVEGPLPAIDGERLRLRQVFQNLIDNAIKYMGSPGASAGPRRIAVGAVLRDEEVEFRVSDTGVGIHADDLDKVFLVFRRGRNTAAANVAGKGVGLASVKSIVETYGGRIWVESRLGEGSTFRFTIGAKHVPALSGAGPAPAGGEETESLPRAA